MDEHVYRVIQLVGSSEKSVSDAIERGRLPVHRKRCATCAGSRLSRPAALSKTVRFPNQVMLKVGFTMED